MHSSREGTYRVPSQKHSKVKPGTTAPKPSARTATGTGPSAAAVARRVFILGAGVDITFGVPAMSSLLRDLAAFAKGDGRPVHDALKKRLPNLRFGFDKYAGDQSNVMLRQLLGSDSEGLIATLRTTATLLKDDPEAASIGPLLESLCTFGEHNQLSGDVATGLAAFAGMAVELSGGEAVLDPDRVALTPVMAQALRHAFVRVLQMDDFDPAARERLEYFIEATSNVEDLMSLYFMRFSLGRQPDQKSFVYIVWMLWAFLRFKSFNPPVRQNSIYGRLRELGADVITFNYTDFFDSQTARRVSFFHGRLTDYLKLDSRELVSDAGEAGTIDGIVSFLDSLRLDVAAVPAIDVPSFVPPTKFKPVMSRTQLRTWANADDLIRQASTAVIVGYSFALADEHFNDMLRHANPRLRVVVVNPDMATASREASRVLGIAADELTSQQAGDFETRRAGRLVCVAAKAEDVSEDFLRRVL